MGLTASEAGDVVSVVNDEPGEQYAEGMSFLEL